MNGKTVDVAVETFVVLRAGRVEAVGKRRGDGRGGDFDLGIGRGAFLQQRELRTTPQVGRFPLLEESAFVAGGFVGVSNFK